jgi:hypothetical protein
MSREDREIERLRYLLDQHGDRRLNNHRHLEWRIYRGLTQDELASPMRYHSRLRRPTTEAVRKPREFLQTIAQSEIFRDFFASKRSEGSKK